MYEALIIAEYYSGEIQKATYEVVASAKKINQIENIKISLVLIVNESCPKELIDIDVDEIIFAEIAFPQFCYITHAEVIKDLIESRKPKYIIASDTIRSSEYIPYLINICKELKLQQGINDIRKEKQQLILTKNYLNESYYIDLEVLAFKTLVIVIKPGAFSYTAAKGWPKISHVEYGGKTPARNNVECVAKKDEIDQSIENSEILLAIGRGIKSKNQVEKFIDLANLIGASLVCSRPIKDYGWLPKSRLVGYSGFTPRQCKLYIAFGISGALHHVIGLKHVETIVAVNTDSNSAIFDIADYGIVEDLNPMADELIEKFSDLTE